MNPGTHRVNSYSNCPRSILTEWYPLYTFQPYHSSFDCCDGYTTFRLNQIIFVFNPVVVDHTTARIRRRLLFDGGSGGCGSSGGSGGGGGGGGFLLDLVFNFILFNCASISTFINIHCASISTFINVSEDASGGCAAVAAVITFVMDLV